MPIGVYIIALAAAALLAIPLLTYLPEPFSLIGLLVLTVAFPIIVVWLLQMEVRKNQ